MMLFAMALIFSVGLIKLLMVMMPQLMKSLLTSAILLMFSRRSSREKPRLLLMPERMLSPSSTWQIKPRS